MDRNDVSWRGYWPAAPTPFTEGGELDEAALRALLHLYRAQGVHGVLVNGSTGEWFSQSDEERKRVAEIAVDELGGTVPVVIGCTTYTPQHTIELGQHAARIGADGILSTPPPYAVPTPREVVNFYQAISDQVSLPLMVYSWARGTNVEIDRNLALELAAIDRVAAIKDSTANKVQALETLEAVIDRVRVFGTFINRTGLGVLREIGGDGNIDGGGLGAGEGVGFYEAFWRGDLEAARGHARAYVNLSRQLINPDWSGRFGSPSAQLKAAMNMLGQPGGYPRPPLLPIEDPECLAGIVRVLASAGLRPVQSATA